MITLQVHRSYVKARTPSGPSTTQRENDVTCALTESGHERLRLPMELLGALSFRAVPIIRRCETVLLNQSDWQCRFAIVIGSGRRDLRRLGRRSHVRLRRSS